jgi:hypothetical protein
MKNWRTLFYFVVVLTAVLQTSCSRSASSNAQGEMEKHHTSEIVIPCSTDEDCPRGASCTKKGVCAVTYLRDDTDAGDDIWKAGCHWFYSDADCFYNKTFHAGDSCLDKTRLSEWTNPECHPPQGDIKEYDCDVECRRIGAPGGVCIYDPHVCGLWPSARCLCIGVTP